MILEIDVSDAGDVTRVRVLKSLDPGLDDNSVNAVKQWRYEVGKARQFMIVECNFAILGKVN